MNIAIAGAGYVGLSNAMLLARENFVSLIDIDPQKIEKLKNKISPIDDEGIKEYLSNKKINFNPTTSHVEAYSNADFVIIATPTDYDPETNYFNTHSVDSVVQDILSTNSNSVIIIKSTLPVGHTEKLQDKFNSKNIIFSPEFLREGSALYDNLYPSRIILGQRSKNAKIFSKLMIDAALKEDIEVLYTNSNEAEAIKLFSNTYLAMRVSFFNELDTYAEVHELDSRDLINGIGMDPRIGSHYNNPSFGYGGYCLPKDTKQLLSDFNRVPNSLIASIVESNEVRKDFIANSIISKKPNIVGVYRIIMKTNSDNYRYSSVQGIIERIVKCGIKVIIFEPEIIQKKFLNSDIISDLEDFKMKSSVIIANRLSENLKDVADKVYTRDLFNSD